MKCLLAARLTWFGLSTLLWFGSSNKCILIRFLWSKNHARSSSNRGLCCFNSYRPTLLLAVVLIFSLMFSQALFMSSLSFRFSNAANLSQIWVWYSFLTSRLLSVPRLNLTSNFCAACLITANLSLTFETTRQWSVSQSAPLKVRYVHRVYSNINSCLSTCDQSGCESSLSERSRVFMNVSVQESRARLSDVVKFTLLTPLYFYRDADCHPPLVGLKIPSSSNFALQYSNRIFTWYLGKWRKTCSNSA